MSTRPPKLRLLCKLSVLELYIKTKASVPGYNIGKQIIDDRSELATSLVTNHVRLVFKYSLALLGRATFLRTTEEI